MVSLEDLLSVELWVALHNIWHMAFLVENCTFLSYLARAQRQMLEAWAILPFCPCT